MGPYSMDLRRRVAQAVDNQEGSLRQLARRFCVSLTFVTRLLRRRRQTGSLAPSPTAVDIVLPWTRRASNACGSCSRSSPMPPWRSWPSGLAVAGWLFGEPYANSRSPARRRYTALMSKGQEEFDSRRPEERGEGPDVHQRDGGQAGGFPLAGRGQADR